MCANFARHLFAERGVRHGRLVTVPVEFEQQNTPMAPSPAGAICTCV
jgi:hypothetical protein